MHPNILLQKLKARKNELAISFDDIAKISNTKKEIIVDFFESENMDVSILKKITTILGLDITGKEIVDIVILREKRAKEKAIYIVSLVQDTSSLEMQGLDNEAIKLLIEYTKEQFLTGEYQKNLWAN